MNQTNVRETTLPQSLLDNHRKVHKKDGGTITKENIEVMKPVPHMQLHGTYKEREEALDKLKSMMDARGQMLKMRNAMSNRILAFERETDNIQKSTLDYLHKTLKECNSELGKMERKIEKHLRSMPHPIIHAALEIHGLGYLSIAQILCYVEIEKARYASSLWSYVGLDKPSHKRYTKNESGGGNKTLRTQLYAMAESFIKSRNVYRDVYDNEKLKLEASENITTSRNTQGHLIECKWSETKPSHRHGAAIRKMIKHFLADFWYVWRTLEGLDTPMLYPEAKLGHKGIITPEERGWKIIK